MNFFITGGSRGIGAGLVRDLAAAGHDIAFTYRENKALAEALVGDMAAAHPERVCRAYALDVRDSAAVDAVGEQVQDDFEQIDSIVVNAAANHIGLALSTSDEDWRDILETNLSGSFYLTRQFIPHFLANRSGRFLFMSSVAAYGMSGASAYAASKAGLLGLMKSIAKEYGAKGITSNALVLGYFNTDMTRELAPQEQHDLWLKLCPVRRVGEISEIAAAVQYLSSAGGAFVNGEALNLTGGLNWAA